jgi:hypothetical protein
MDGEFLRALVDSIAPGGSVTVEVTLPPASAVGCDRALAGALDSNSTLQGVVDAIAARAGGMGSFSSITADQRQSLLEAVQNEKPAAFMGLVALVLAHYYAQPQVLEALNWPARPPQPEGHELPAFDESLLRPVLARGAIWRQC